MGDPLGAPMGDPVGASGSGNVALLSSPRQPQNRADQQDGTLGLVGPRTRCVETVKGPRTPRKRWGRGPL